MGPMTAENKKLENANLAFSTPAKKKWKPKSF